MNILVLVQSSIWIWSQWSRIWMVQLWQFVMVKGWPWTVPGDLMSVSEVLF